MTFRAAIAAAIMLASFSASAIAASQPPQPTTGPGGSTLPYSSTVTTARANPSNDDLSYWIITPTGWVGGGTAPTKLPLVVFVHGFSQNQPANYASWINHIARQGNVVIFPKYQNFFTFSAAVWTPNAISSVKDALSKPFPSIPPDTTLGMIIVSHSAGGLVSMNMANRYAANGLPKPTALVLAAPYFDPAIDASLSGIPATARVLCMVGNVDTNVGRKGCDALWDRGAHIVSRDYVWIFSDSHGTPALTADHYIAADSQGPINAFDWNALWKFSDAMQTCVLGGTDCAYIDGGGPLETSLGLWSDGVPVIPMSVSTTKPACPAGSTALGC